MPISSLVAFIIEKFSEVAELTGQPQEDMLAEVVEVVQQMVIEAKQGKSVEDVVALLGNLYNQKIAALHEK